MRFFWAKKPLKISGLARAKKVFKINDLASPCSVAFLQQKLWHFCNSLALVNY
jgi:hypothetical protein